MFGFRKIAGYPFLKPNMTNMFRSKIYVRKFMFENLCSKIYVRKFMFEMYYRWN